MMRFARLFFILFMVCSLNVISICSCGASPVLFYSDITSGPNYGGQNNKGVFVTVWGKNFGSERNESVVTVGGNNVDNYPVWSDSMVCFQLGSNAKTGDIILTTPLGSSNPIPFTVRSGSIYFITPEGSGTGDYEDPCSPYDFVEHLRSGEKGVTGYFIGGEYTEQYAIKNWHANFCLSDDYSGAPGLENAFIAYPGEVVRIETSSTSGADRNNFRLHTNPAKYIVVAKLKCYSLKGSIHAHTGWRIINNNINAIHELSGSGAISTGGYQDPTPHHIYIYGNEISGGTSGNKLDHAIYPGSGVNYLYVGWNYIHDNNFGAGPMISLNCNDSFEHKLVSQHVYFHSNIIDVSTFPSRAMGVFETGLGSEVTYYNNLIICSEDTSNYSTFYAMSANVKYYNNTLYSSGGTNLAASFSFYSSVVYGHQYAPESIEIKNNIVYSNSKADYYIRVSGIAPMPIVQSNLFFNIQSPRDDDKYLLDEGRIISDPLFVDIQKNDFRLKNGSPAKYKAQVINLVTMDLDGVQRHIPPSLGAYEIQNSFISSPAEFKCEDHTQQ